MRRAAMVQLPACRSVNTTSAPVSSSDRRMSVSRSAALRSLADTARKTSPRPVICWTADTIPAAKSPCPATMARTGDGGVGDDAGSLIVFLKVLPHFGRSAHFRDQALVEPLRRIDAAVLEQMIHRDHFADDRDVLARIQQHANLGQLDIENLRRLAVEPRAIHDRVGVPVLQLHDDLDALLLAHGTDAEDGGNVHEPDAADLHVVALQLVATSDEHVVPSPADED